MAVFRTAFASDTLFRTVNVNIIISVETYGRAEVKKPEKFKTLYLLHGFGGSQGMTGQTTAICEPFPKNIILRLFFRRERIVSMKI